MTASRRVAVLGGGILGTCTALELAARGQRVTLVEGADSVLQGASRWNEGKIHLGFLYAGDSTLKTAARIIPGGLAFPELMSRHVGQCLDPFTTDDDVFLVHRDSVVDAGEYGSYAARTALLIADAANSPGAGSYFSDVRSASVHKLTPSELSDATSSDSVVAGFRVPERSVSTVPLADLLCQRLLSEPLIDVHTETWVTAVRRRDDGRLDVISNGGVRDELCGFDTVVNALWEGRPAIDATLGIVPPAPWSHRFRAGIFARAPKSTLSGGVLCVGPFGDIKRYADGRLYLSWYQSGLLAEGVALEPPRGDATLTPERAHDVLRGTLAGLAHYFPAVAELKRDAEELQVRGGWVYAVGQGSLADRASTLHQRDKFNMTVDRGYISVDTAKYSLAPWLAERVANVITGN